MQLICFPYAGAHVNVFVELQNQIKIKYPHMQVMSVEYAGHGRRFSETSHKSIQENAADLYTRITATMNKEEEIIMLGYSMGSIVAYEVAQMLIREGYNVVKLIFMAATPPHRIDIRHEDLSGDEELLLRCKHYGLIKEGQFDSSQMRKLFLPALRNDINSVNTYNVVNNYQSHTFDEKVQIAVFLGQQDLSVTDEDHWTDLSENDVQYHFYPSGHFFLYDHQNQVSLDVIDFITNSNTTIF